jgi:hypothetical protein
MVLPPASGGEGELEAVAGAWPRGWPGEGEGGLASSSWVTLAVMPPPRGNGGVVPAAGVGGWSRKEDVGWEIRRYPSCAAALSFADAVSAAASTEGASAPAGEVSAAAPRRALPRWHRRLADDGLKSGLLVVAGGERKKERGTEGEQFNAKSN